MTSGVESWRAMWMPGEALVAPGPRVTKQTPGRPVALPTASHHAGTALLPAHGDGKVAVVESVEHRKVALARHTERVLYAVNAQLVDQNLRGGPHVILGAHEVSPSAHRCTGGF